MRKELVTHNIILEAVSLLAVLSTVGIVYHHPLILAALMLLSDL